MGSVFRATDLRTGGPVAVKLLHPAYARNASYRERLRREAQIAASLTSPRVVRVVDLDEQDGVPFLVQEYVAGETLGRQLEREGKLPLGEALAIVREVAHALDAAHAAGIVHRDLKPNNVKLVDGQVKVLDFGIARAEGIPSLTATDSWLGTVEYIAPERGQGLGDIRSDLYSLGVILFLLVTGRLPFSGPAPLAILRQHESTPPPIPDDLPPMVQAILARCLAKDPERRYQAPADLIADLDEALDPAVGGQAEDRSEPSRTAERTALLPKSPGTPSVLGPVPPNNLPLQVTSFVGRERECAALSRLLPEARALTLTGPGGIGKTRLALQIAATEAERYQDGAWLVPLANLPDGDSLTETIAGVLGVREVPRRALAETLAEWLRPRRLLLLLDNCEHVIAACAALVNALLQTCPHLQVLATSREPLGIAGEVVWRVPPLELRSEAVQLFSERAAAARPDFRVGPETEPLVAEIGRRLDGLPLAIELAAARVKVLSVSEIAGRLNDRFRLLTAGSRTALPHHQTLRAAIGWSYELLSAEEQTVFRRLGVFARGCTLDAAEAVIPDSLGGSSGAEGLGVLDGLAALVDKSLLTHEADANGRSRYTMLQTIREYALERLRENGEERAVAMRHLDHCVRLAETADRALRGRDQLTWLARLDEEHDNFRAVLDWCADGSASPPAAAGRGLRLAAALGWYWYLRGQRSEGRTRLGKLLPRAVAADPDGAAAPVGARAMARAVAAHLGFWGADPAPSVALADRACRQARESGDPLVLAWCLLYRAVVEPRGTNTSEAVARWTETLTLFRAAGENWGVALSLAWLGRYAFRAGDAALAVQQLEESQSLFRLLGDRWGIALALARLASVAEHAGHFAKAEAYLEEQQALARELGHQGAVAGGLNRLAGLSLRRGDVVQAKARFEQSLATFRAIGEQRSMAAPLRQLARLVAHHNGDTARAEALLRESLRVWQGQDGVTGPIRSLLGCADVALLRAKQSQSGQLEARQVERAVRLLSAAEAEMTHSRGELDAFTHAQLEQEAAELRRALREAGAARDAAEAGPALSLAEAIDYALQSEG